MYTSPGNVPTDKLFTGQRFDDTSLYYYNARYYDPLIGRFISPDTVVAHPANPQSFNRYSYCLNNPLKYVDPSGHDVEIEVIGNVESINDITTEQWLWLAMSGRANEVMALFNAWEFYKTEYSVQAELMESSENTYTFTYGNTSPGSAGETHGDQRVVINNEYIGNTILSAAYIAHEVIHLCITGPNSIYEETLAFQAQYRIMDKYLGTNGGARYNIDLSLPRSELRQQLEGIQQKFQRTLDKIRDRNLTQNVTFEAWETTYPYTQYVDLDIFPANYDSFRRFIIE